MRAQPTRREVAQREERANKQTKQQINSDRTTKKILQQYNARPSIPIAPTSHLLCPADDAIFAVVFLLYKYSYILIKG